MGIASTSGRYGNCFFYFRGPSSKKKEADIDRQLEDNATKALVNVLEHGGSELLPSFLIEVIGSGLSPGAASPEYYLQGGPTLPSGDPDISAPMRILVGLSSQGEIDPASWGTSDDAPTGSRIDGTIHVPGVLTVLLETKVVDLLDGAQLQRHADKWGLPLAESRSGRRILPEQWRIITWGDVDRWARSTLLTDLSPVPRFLVDQLVGFLGNAGLAPSWTFEPVHFEFFDGDPENRDPATQSEIRTRLASAWGQIEHALGPELFEESLGGVRVGHIKKKSTGAFSQSHANDPKSTERPNLTVELYAPEVSVNLIGWFDGQLKIVRHWLATASGEEFVKDNPDYELVIFKRMAPKGVWQGADGPVVDRIPLGGSTGASLVGRIDELESRLNPKTEKLSLHVRRAWPRKEAIGNDELAGEMAREVERLIPVLELVRRSDFVTKSS